MVSFSITIICVVLYIFVSVSAQCPSDSFNVHMDILDIKHKNGRHPDFQRGFPYPGFTTGIVNDTLDANGRPVRLTTNIPWIIRTETSFDSWFVETPGINIPLETSFQFVRITPGEPTFETVIPGTEADGDDFFPINDQGWEDHSSGNNYGFTCEIHLFFVFRDAGEIIHFRGDDDFWLFINDILIIDLGGTHSTLTREITLTLCDINDPNTKQLDSEGELTNLCLQNNTKYKIDAFKAERHTSGSTYYMKSSVEFVPSFYLTTPTPMILTEEQGFMDIVLTYTHPPTESFTIVCTTEDNAVTFNDTIVTQCEPSFNTTVRAYFVSASPFGMVMNCSTTPVAPSTSAGNYELAKAGPFTIITTTTRPPNITNLEASVQATCVEPTPLDPAMAVVFDYCGGNVTVTRNDTITSQSCPHQLSRVYTYTMVDLCNNIATQDHYVTVTDIEPPILNETPFDVSVQCDAVPLAPTVTANDTCAGSVSVSYLETRDVGECTYRYVLTRKWTSFDLCGSGIEYNQNVTVLDDVGPTFAGSSPNATIDAFCTAIPSNPSSISATDSCDGSISASLVSVENMNIVCSGEYDIERVWQATDSCGNSNNYTSVVHVTEGTPPSFTSTPSSTVTSNCIAGAAPILSATAVCNQTAIVTFDETTTPDVGSNGVPFCTARQTISRVWTATSECGMTTNTSQTEYVVDDDKPDYDGAFPDYSLPVSCESVPAMPIMNATDTCSGSATVTNNETRVDGACPYAYDLVRTWTAQDECGNRNISTHTLTVVDNTEPTLSGMPSASINLQCFSMITDISTDISMINSTDSCAGVSPVTGFDFTTSFDCINNQTIDRTFNSIDSCGNQATFVSTMIILDTTPPTFTAFPDNITMECNETLPAVGDGITVDDNCGTVTLTFVSEQQIDGNCDNNYVLLRTYRADDECGLSTTQVHAITVQDTYDPILVDPPSSIYNISCTAVPLPPTPLALDSCPGIVTVTSNSVDIIDIVGNPFGCSSRKVINRTFTATDVCGNTNTATQLIGVIDNDPPIINGIPADSVISSDDYEDYEDPVLDASDACQPAVLLNVTVVDITREPPVCNESFTDLRTFMSMDDCGNQVLHIQRLTITNESAPILFGVPVTDFSVGCDAVPIAANVTALSGNGDNLDVTVSSTVLFNGCSNRRTISYTYTAQDQCGITTGDSYSFSVIEDTPPEFIDAPVNMTVECDAVPAVDSDIYAVDSCPGDVTLTFNEILNAGTCEHQYELIRTWLATDVCSVSDTFVQGVTVMDTVAPALLGVPADIGASCDSIPAVASVSAMDNCSGSRTVTLLESSIDGPCTYNYTLVRSWSTLDECNNERVSNQTISVTDTTNPILLNLPTNITVACSAIPVISTVNVQDNCDTSLTVATVNEIRVNGSCSNEFALHRTYTATDVCGNMFEDTQVVTVIDQLLPTFDNPPADIEVECDAIPAIPTDITASDICGGDVVVTASEERIDGSCGSSYTLLRTFTATDVCNNVNTYLQTITVQDTSPPVLFGLLEQNVTLECESIYNVPPINATDNCATNAEITIILNIDDTPGGCLNDHVALHTWSATDLCGNFDSLSQTITYIDNTIPAYHLDPDIFDGLYPPAVLNITYNESDIDEISLSDNIYGGDICSSSVTCQAVGEPACENDILGEVMELRTNGSCPYEYVLSRQWILRDECLNEHVISQTIYVEDFEIPVFESVPMDVDILCSSDIPPAISNMPTVTDNSDDLVVTSNDEVLPLEPGDDILLNKMLIRRTFTAVDACGNSNEHVQLIRVNDTVPPVLTGSPSYITTSCDALFHPDNVTIVATDNCDGNIANISLSSSVLTGNCTYRRTTYYSWESIDDSGNIGTLLLVDDMLDTDPPEFFGLPESFVEYGCTDSFDAPPVVTASDVCSGNSSVQLVINAIDHCLDAEKRTWTSTDECGNVNVYEQIVQQSDYDPPVVLYPPVDLDVNTALDVPPFEVINATEGCSGYNVTQDENIVLGCSESFILTRMWSVIDLCGNIYEHSQTINVGDVTPPQFILPEISGNYHCTDDASNVTAILSGEDIDRPINMTESVIPSSCVHNFTLVRHFEASDTCGNYAEVEINLPYSDNVPPVFSALPPLNDISVSCVAPIADTGAVIAVDDCAGAGEIFVHVVNMYNETNPCDTKGTLSRYYLARDPCGNEAYSDTQRITLIDDFPDFDQSQVPSDFTIGCNDIVPAAANLDAFDDCGDAEVTMTETVSGFPCASGFVFKRTFTAIDSCNQHTTHEQRITVLNDAIPVFEENVIDTEIEVSCDDVRRNDFKIPSLPVVATETCLALDFSSSLEIKEDIEVLDGGELTRCNDGILNVIRTFNATSTCGRVSTRVQNIVVVPLSEEGATFTISFEKIKDLLDENTPDILSVLEEYFPDLVFTSLGTFEEDDSTTSITIRTTYDDGTLASSVPVVNKILTDRVLQKKLEDAAGGPLTTSELGSRDTSTSKESDDKSAVILAVIVPVGIIALAAFVGLYMYTKKDSLPSDDGTMSALPIRGADYD